jgi:5-methylcytosine-specific restriction endonuclease McrA
MSDPPAINPFVSEDGGGHYDGEGDYVYGPDDFAGERDPPIGWGQPLDPGRAAGRRFATRGMRNRVGECDGWVCHICGGPIDRRVRPPDPLTGVADHYPVARVDGGPTSLDNLRIAHAVCNDRAGTRHPLTR